MCSFCNKLAAIVTLNPIRGKNYEPSPGQIDVVSENRVTDDWLVTQKFFGDGGLLVSKDVDKVYKALKDKDAKALKAIDYEFAYFYCRDCGEVYCSDCWDWWEIWDGCFFEERRGRCPMGHEHQLDD